MLLSVPSEEAESKAQSLCFSYQGLSQSGAAFSLLVSPWRGTAAMSFVCRTGSFVPGKDILVFHFSGKEQRQFLCRDLILDLFSVPRLAQAIALGNRLVYGKERNEKLALVRAVTTSRRLWRNTAKGEQSTGKTRKRKILCWPR